MAALKLPLPHRGRGCLKGEARWGVRVLPTLRPAATPLAPAFSRERGGEVSASDNTATAQGCGAITQIAFGSSIRNTMLSLT
jgi:hypothetical protein